MQRAGNLGLVALLIMVGVLLLFHSCAVSPGSQSQTNSDSKLADPELLRMLTDELERQLAALPPRQTSAPPRTIKSQTVLSLSNNTQLDWGYYSQGDYDQNGEVNVSDLTPLAIHFKESVAPATFAPDSIQAVIDGDGNGEINLADVTPIAINFQNTVTAYNVYGSLDQADYPGDDPANGNGQADDILLVHFDEAIGDPAQTRLAFSTAIPTPRVGDWLWLRPEDTGIEGIASNIVGPVVHPGYTIRGKIIDPHSTVPSLEGLVVNLAGTGFSSLTDSGGNFEFSGVPSGGYDVAPFSFELYFEPVQLETTVGTEDINVADISAFNINTAHTFGIARDRLSYNLAVSGTGEVLLTGATPEYETDSDIILVKYDQTHGLDWAKAWDSGFQDKLASVVANPDGSFLMVCSSELIMLEEKHWFFSIVKFNSNGEVSWERKWGSLDRDAWPWHKPLKPSLDGDFYLLSSIHKEFHEYDAYGDSDPLVLKLSPGGVVRWQQTLLYPGSTEGNVIDGEVNLDGGINLLGSSWLIDDPTSFMSWFTKLDAEGNIVWAKHWNIIDDSIRDIEEMSSENLMSAGYTEMYADDDKAALLVEISPDGDLVSARKWETNVPSSLVGCAQTPKGGLVCAGNVRTDPTSRPLLFYINPEGELDWSMMWVSEYQVNISKMILDANNNVILSGNGKNNQGYWMPIAGRLETVPDALEDITLETEVPDAFISNTSGTMSPLDGIEDIGSGNTDMLVIWRHISE